MPREACPKWAPISAAIRPVQGQEHLGGGQGRLRSPGQWEGSLAAAPGLCTVSLIAAGREAWLGVQQGVFQAPDHTRTPLPSGEVCSDNWGPADPSTNSGWETPVPSAGPMPLSPSGLRSSGQSREVALDLSLSNSVLFSGPQFPIHQSDRAWGDQGRE